MLTNSFIRQWKACRACSLHESACKHVIGVGSLPADVVFIGEAPGKTENILGRPFVGRAGRLMKRMILASSDVIDHGQNYSWDDIFDSIYFQAYITNLVACIPWTDGPNSTWREPNKAEAEACASRLDEIIYQARPKTIIYVGKCSKKYYKPPKGLPTLQIEHPSSILRLNVPPVLTVSYHKAIDQLKTHFRQLGIGI